MFEPKTLRHFEHELRVMLSSAADHDPEAIVALEDLLRDALENGIPQAVAAQRDDAPHLSWESFRRARGLVTRSAAQKRYTVRSVATQWIKGRRSEVAA